MGPVTYWSLRISQKWGVPAPLQAGCEHGQDLSICDGSFRNVALGSCSFSFLPQYHNSFSVLQLTFIILWFFTVSSGLMNDFIEFPAGLDSKVYLFFFGSDPCCCFTFPSLVVFRNTVCSGKLFQSSPPNASVAVIFAPSGSVIIFIDISLHLTSPLCQD